MSVRGRVKRSAALHFDVQAIAATCIEHRAVAGLLAAVRRVEGDSYAMRALDDWWAGQHNGSADERQPTRPTVGLLWRVPSLPPHFLARPAAMARWSPHCALTVARRWVSRP